MTITTSVSLDSNPVWYEGRDLLNYGIKKLSDKEGDIFDRYFYEQNTLREIAKVYGVTRSRIHQIVTKVRAKVKKRLDGR